MLLAQQTAILVVVAIENGRNVEFWCVLVFCFFSTQNIIGIGPVIYHIKTLSALIQTVSKYFQKIVPVSKKTRTNL